MSENSKGFSIELLLSRLRRIPIRNSKLGIFAFFFWMWVVCVSLWIDTEPVQSVPEGSREQKFSQINFKDIQFEQTNSDGALVSLKSSDAKFDSETGKMTIAQPTLEWQNAANGKVVSASSQTGEFYAELTETALPSTFRYIILSGSAAVQGENSRVDSDRMIFDNEKRFFIFPGSFTFKKGKLSLQNKRMCFDPLKDKTPSLDNLLKSDPELQTFIQTIGQAKP